MTALFAILSAILSAIIGNKVIMTIFASVVTGLGLYVAGGINRAKKDKAAQVAADAKATTEGQKIDDAVAGRTPDDNRGRLSRWSRS